MNKMGWRITIIIIAVAGMACLVRGGDANNINDDDLEYLIQKSDFVGVGRIIDEPIEKCISGYIPAFYTRFKCEIVSTMKGAINQKVIDVYFGYSSRMPSNLFKGSNIMLFLARKDFPRHPYQLISESILPANDYYAGKIQAIISNSQRPTPTPR